ncbi:MAG: hypothetical protein HQL96_10710 [Magnetococcales bacterium]|nr:hypothetical protein [Magnetococcales bacterium]
MEEPIHPQVGRGPLAWLLLGISSLALSSLCALLLAAARMPGLSERFAGREWIFNTALVLHVDLSVTVWFLAFTSALWSLAGGTRMAGLDRTAFVLSLTGGLLLLAAPWLASGQPVLSDYLPVLRNPVFLGGVVTLGIGFALAATRALLVIPRGGMVLGGVPGSGLRAAALCHLLALLACGTAFARLPDELQGKAYFNPLFWAGGHLLQFTHILTMLTVWLALARRAGIPMPFGATGQGRILWLGALPALLGAWPGLSLAPDSPEQRLFFTSLMVWGNWWAVPWIAGGIAWGYRRRTAPLAANADNALWGSMLLLGLGIATGTAIHNDSVLVTAHYHGTVGAITLAYMGMTLTLLPDLGRTPVRPALARLQARVYPLGLSLVILGLAWSGANNAPRKTPLASHAPEGMALMGAGAAIALTATFLFLVPALRALLGGRLRRGSAVLLAVLSIGALGGMIRFWPHNDTTTLRIAPEVATRFEQGAMMLHAKQYEHALTAFHWVLQHAPELPEAHVNMGFAMLGLERPEVARDFFQTAITLRPEQVNAYYGLALSLEELKDRPGAIGAMRTFVHLSKEETPFVRKARAALWEWGQAP